MEEKVLIDTHVALWLSSGEKECFTQKTKKLLNSHAIYLSPISLLEISLLFEIKRIKVPTEKIIEILEEAVNLKILDDSFETISKSAISIKWTRDPFDRLLVAHANFRNLKLVTKDRYILKNYTRAVW